MVSVIIPTYNEQKVIGECLDSVSRQSYQDLEIIIVDDGSTDGTVKIITNKYQFQISNFQLLKQIHKGAGAARNLGAKHAKGDILVFVDADMTFDKDFVKNLVSPIERGEAIGSFSKDEFLANKDNIWARCWNINRGFPPDKMHPSDYSDTQKVFRAILKKEFDKSGGFDEKAGYTDDWSLSEKLGVEAVAASHAIFYHKNPETISELFTQSKWTAKRKYKLGLLGYLVALTRVSFPISIVLGILLATYYMLPSFLIFKLVSDFGQFIGIIEYVALGKAYK